VRRLCTRTAGCPSCGPSPRCAISSSSGRSVAPGRFHSVATLIRVPSAARTERRSFASRREQRTAGGQSPRRCGHFHATAPSNGDNGCRRVAHNPPATRRRPLPRSRPIRSAPLEEKARAIQTPHPAKPAAKSCRKPRHHAGKHRKRVIGIRARRDPAKLVQRGASLLPSPNGKAGRGL